MTSLPQLAVVTVTFNAELFINEFINCCLSQTHRNFELIIIDNNSLDGTVSSVRTFNDQRIKVITNSENIGYAAACNQAILYFQQLDYDEILFINNDTIFDEFLFENLLASRIKYGVNAITPRITYASDMTRNWYAGGRFNYWRGFQGEHIGEGLLNNSIDTSPRLTPVASGCCVLFSIDTFISVGLFDSELFVYGEDTDFFIRMQNQRMSLLYHPGIAIAHKISLSTGGVKSDFSIRYYHRNQIYLIRKHLNKFWIPIQITVIFSKALIRFLLGIDKGREFVLRMRGVIEGFKVKVQRQIE